MKRKILDIGEKFGLLTIVNLSEKTNKRKQKFYHCVCECSNQLVVSQCNLVTGHTKSCGCLVGEKMPCKPSHPLYRTYTNAKTRCFNKNNAKYHRYGGRGITMCDEWRNSFTTFYNWAITNGWQEGLQIDRIDNDGNYTPENCHFVTSKQNARNKSINNYLEYKGERKTLCDWADFLKIPRSTLCQRLSVLNWSIEKTLTTPVKNIYA